VVPLGRFPLGFAVFAAVPSVVASFLVPRYPGSNGLPLAGAATTRLGGCGGEHRRGKNYRQ